MEAYIQISKINDFLYSPKSLYLHKVYESFDPKVYHELPQQTGKINHEGIENKTYSTSKNFIQGKTVYSQKYNILGKIDIYDLKKKALIERKTRVKRIFQGYRYQLYAQMFAMQEMGYEVKSLFIHSLEDNKRYEISLPNLHDIRQFEKIINKMKSFELEGIESKDFKSSISIYRYLDF